ncbi:MAG: DUF983 domain-containing protein [Rhodospirillaceae bacterium]
MADDHARAPSPIRNGILGRCPRCGSGRLYSGYLKVADSCSACGLEYAGHDAGDGPVVPIMLVVGLAVVGLAFWLELSFTPPVWVHMVLWPPVISGLCLALLPPIKGFFIGAQFKYRAVDNEFPDEDV